MSTAELTPDRIIPAETHAHEEAGRHLERPMAPRAKTMRAVVCRHYGSPDELNLEELPVPSPGDGEVLVQVRAASVNAGDWHLMRGTPFPVRLVFGLTKPKHPVLGSDVAGRVEAVGKNVSHFQVGDEVFGDISEFGFGAFAEYVCVSEDAFAPKPCNLSFEEAAAVPAAAMTALQGLRDQEKFSPVRRS